MDVSKGYYCVVQFIPDLSRAESANIGVLLFVPERQFFAVRLARDNARVRHFFGVAGDDLKRLTEFKRSFAKRVEVERLSLESVEQLNKFIDTRANQIQLTSPRFIKVDDCKSKVDSLFQELVGGETRKRDRVKLEEKLQKRFESAGVSNRVETNVPVHVPVLARDITVPFGYQNGAFNLLQPVRFHAESTEININRACKYSIEGQSLQNTPDAERGLLSFNVLGSFKSKGDESIKIVRRVLKENDVRLFTESEMPNLIDEIRRTGKIIE